MKPVIASLLALLSVACTAQAPAGPTPEPAATSASQRPAATPASQAPAQPPPPRAKRAPGDDAAPMATFRAFGNEPFWNVNVEDATLTYTTPEDPEGTVMHGERRTIVSGVEVAGTHEGKPFTLRVIAGACSDGMSDNQYKLTSTFRYGDAEYRGCGEEAK